MPTKYNTFLAYYTRAKDGLEVKAKDAKMHRVLGLFQLVTFGMAAVIGAGIFVITGIQAKTNAGPAVMLSYLLSGAVATLTALCYAEFASEVIITGGAFAYATMMYGKFFGWLVGANTMMEYMLAGSTVAKGFASYFTTLIGQPSGSLQFCVASCGDADSAIIIDPIALAAVVILTLIMAFGVKESFWFNAVTVVMSTVAILLCIFMGAPKVNTLNFTQPHGFFPFGINGVVAAASSVFFAYVGFDIVANGAEEARNPKRDIPLATALCLGICTLLYAAAATVIAGMVPYYEIDSNAPFSVALAKYYPAASYIVSIGACAGTFNSAFADIYAMSRLTVVMSRCRLIPPFLAKIHPRTQSPVVATCISGSIIGIIAFFLPLTVLGHLVSMGTLVAFSVVTISVAIRSRYSTDMRTPKWRIMVPTFLVVAGSCIIAIPFYYRAHWGAYIAGGVLFIAGVVVFYTLPVVYRPEGFAVPLNPFLPCLGTLVNIFLIGSLGPSTWIPWCYAMLAAVVLFVLNGFYQHRVWWNKGGKETVYEAVDPLAVTDLPSITRRTSSRFGGSFQCPVAPGSDTFKSPVELDANNVGAKDGVKSDARTNNHKDLAN